MSPPRTLAAGVRSRDNAFGLLRLVLAVMVIICHAWPLGGHGPDPVGGWTHEQVNFGIPALVGFFGISGYLITLSGLASDPVQFVWQRMLRVLPAFWTVLIVGALVFGPIGYLIQHGGLAGYWTLGPGGPFAYVADNATLFINQFGIHDVFAPTPWGMTVDGSVINGSVWTLYYEARCYLVVLLLMITGLLRRAPWLVPVGAAITLAMSRLVQIVPAAVPVATTVYGPDWGPRLAAVFLLGATAAVYADRVPLRWWLGAVAGLITLGTLVVGGFAVLGYVSLTYFVLWAATCAPGWAKRAGSTRDLSYGVYLYAFPVQLLLALVGWHRLGLVPYVVLSLVITLPLAMLSWFFVERPALRWKRRGPGQGLQVIRARVRGGAGSTPRSTSNARRWPSPTADTRPTRVFRDS